jgi:branched-chain amino acid transport system substrate-binding protein
MNRLWHLLTAAAALLTLAGAPAQAQDGVKIGVVAHFSGPFAAAGKQYREGIEAFIAANGSKAGGREIEMIYRDIGGANPAAAKQAVQELIVRDKVSVLTGFYLSPDAAAAVSVLNETKTPAVILTAAARNLTQQSPYFVRIGGTLYQTSTPAAEWSIKNGAKKAYIAVSDYAPGHDAQAAFKERFQKLGGEIIGEDRMALNTMDYAPFIERLANANPDVVFTFLPNGTPTTNLMRGLAARELMKKGMKFISVGVPDDPDLPGVGEAAIGFHSSLYYTYSLPHAENQKFVKLIQDKLGADAVTTFQQAQAYDGMTVVYKMLASQAGKPFDGTAAIEAVKGFAWTGPQGPIKIDPETRQSIENVYIRRADRVGNRILNVVADTIEAVRDPGPGAGN